MADLAVTLMCVEQRQFSRSSVDVPVFRGSRHVTCSVCGQGVTLQVDGPRFWIVKAMFLVCFGGLWLGMFLLWHMDWWNTRSDTLVLTDYGVLLTFFIFGPLAVFGLTAGVVACLIHRAPRAITHDQNHRVHGGDAQGPHAAAGRLAPTGKNNDEIGPAVDELRMVVVIATVVGLVLTAIVVFLVQAEPAPAGNGGLSLMTGFCLGAAGIAFVTRIVGPRRFTLTARKQIADGTWQVPGPSRQSAPTPWDERVERFGDRGRLSIVFQLRTHMGVAPLALGAFFLLIDYLIDQSPWALGAAIMAIVGVSLHFPTRSSTARWIEDQLAAIEQLRQIG